MNKTAYTLPSNISINVDSKLEITSLNDFKKHNGILKIKAIKINDFLENTINKILSDHSVSGILNEASEFTEFMKNRRNPVEFKEKEKLINQILEETCVDEHDLLKLSPEERKDLEKFQQRELKTKVTTHLYKWSEIKYELIILFVLPHVGVIDSKSVRKCHEEEHRRLALVYLVSFFTPYYAVMNQIFHEIEKKDPDFKPTHVFDFGSGIGTVMWAANAVWKSDVKEILNSDSSSHMNNLSDLILRGGNSDQKPILSGVSYRQSFPSSSKLKFELVVSAYSLMELVNKRKRKEILDILWKKVSSGGYLVLVEQSNIYGYSLIMEARKYILELCLNNGDLEAKNENEDKFYGHVFSPCPHDSLCPMQSDNLKCTFRARYHPLKIYDKIKHEKQCEHQFSYVVLKKSPRNKEIVSWPRVVHRDPQKLNHHIHSWFCTEHANFDHYIATKHRSGTMYHLTKYLHVGDTLPAIYPDSKLIRADHKIFREEKLKNQTK